MVFDRKSSQVSRTFLSILADLKNSVVWMVSGLPLSKRSKTVFIIIMIIIIYSLRFFFFLHKFKLMILHWSLSDSKTLLSILTVLNNAVVLMVSSLPPASKSPSPFNNPLVTVAKALITIGVIVTFIFHSFFFQFSSKVQVLILLFTFL